MKWNFKKSIYTGFVSVIFLLFVLSLYTYKSSRNFYDSRLWIAHTREVILTAKDIHGLSTGISNLSRGFVITGKDNFSEALTAAETEVQKKIYAIRQLTTDNPGQQSRIRLLDSLITKRIKLSHYQIDARRFNSFEEARELVATWGFQLNEKIDTQLGDIISEENHVLAIRTETARKNWTQFVLLFFNLIFIILLVMIAIIIVILKTIKQKEEAARLLESNEELLQNIINNSGAAIHVKQRDGRFLIVNKKIETLMGLQKEQLIGKTFYDLFPQEIAKQYIMDELEVLRDNKPKEFEQQLMLGNELHTFLSLKFPIFNRENKLEFIGSISTDITERIKIRNMLAQSNEELKNNMKLLAIAKEKAESADHLKSAFLATMSHELRTPLNSILGFTGMMHKGIVGPLNPEQKKQIGMVMNSAQHLLNLINDVLDISKIEAGQLEVEHLPFDMRIAFQKCVDMISPLADKKGLQFEYSLSPDVGEIVSDCKRLEQVLINLLTNAVKFTGSGGVRLVADVVNRSLRVKVIDTGSGIKTEDLDKLFRPFQQVNSGLSRPHEGTGLGLSICKKLMNLLGGEVTVQSEFGKGSTFEMMLPVDTVNL